MADSSLPRSLSWTSLLLLTLLAGFAECAILFPDAVVSTRLAAALSWDAAVSGEPSPEAGVEPSKTPAPEAEAPTPAPQTPTVSAPAEPRGEPKVISGRVLDAGTGSPIRGASIWAGRVEVVTDADGRFTTAPVQAGSTVWVKAPGYERK